MRNLVRSFLAEISTKWTLKRRRPTVARAVQRPPAKPGEASRPAGRPAHKPKPPDIGAITSQM
jgi:hypothetical protein